MSTDKRRERQSHTQRVRDRRTLHRVCRNFWGLVQTMEKRKEVGLMAKYINKEELKQAVRNKYKDIETRIEVNCIVNEMPTIEIVTCKECKHYGTEDDYDMCNISRILHDDNYFCRYGERKNNG